MTIDEHEQEKQRRFQAFQTRFEQESPYAMDVLKGHLLVEEVLQEIIEHACNRPERVSDAKITFFAKNKLAEAICGHESPVWGCIENLNSVRNELAHSMGTAKLELKIDRLIASTKVAFPIVDWSQDRHFNLVMAIVAIHAYISRVAANFCGA
jgi:hypothetical protein